MNSAVYRGQVRHRRHHPVEHEFASAVGMLYLDLDELPAVLEHRPLWSASRRAIGRFRREDYLGDPAVALKDAVAQEILAQTGARHAGPVRLLTTPRTFGRAFNPVSFYYCFAADGETVQFVVAEVTNTPWGERHSYVMDARDSGRPVMRQAFDKVFHVSPFMGMEHRYEWSLTIPGPTLSVHIDSETTTAPSSHAFDATLNLKREPMTASSLRRLLARFPFSTLRTGLYIYAHAIRLKLKGAPYFAHPEGHKPPILTRRPKTSA
jgi:DUF1365 family protein